MKFESKKKNEYNRSITMIILRSSAISASSQRFPSFQRHVGRRLALLGRGLTQLSPARISECRTKRSGRCRFFDVSLAPSRFNLSPFLLFHFPFVERNFRFATYRKAPCFRNLNKRFPFFLLCNLYSRFKNITHRTSLKETLKNFLVEEYI